MMIRPCKPRDSARPALLTAVRNRRSGLALHPPEGYYPAFAAPDWRGVLGPLVPFCHPAVGCFGFASTATEPSTARAHSRMHVARGGHQ